jgi:hypothetical protein
MAKENSGLIADDKNRFENRDGFWNFQDCGRISQKMNAGIITRSKSNNRRNFNSDVIKKIGLCLIRMVVAFFPPYYSYTNPLSVINKWENSILGGNQFRN